MKHKLTFIALSIVILFWGCLTMNGYKTVKYLKHTRDENDRERKSYFYVDIPENYQNHLIVTGGYEDEHQFWYPDSSIIYFTKEKGCPTLNYENIRNQNGAYAKRFTADTLTLEGTGNKGLYWKDVKLGDVSFGYVNIPENKKEIFNHALQSIRKKRKK